MYKQTTSYKVFKYKVICMRQREREISSNYPKK